MDQEAQIKKYSGRLERACWLLVALGMMTQISTDYSFPSYNIALGFWGAYSCFSRHGRATFGFIIFAFFGMILDVVFCSNNRHSSAMFQFLLVTFILCIFCKAYALYQASRFFTSIGGAYSLESSALNLSLYDSLPEQRGGYYPPDGHEQDLGDSSRGLHASMDAERGPTGGRMLDSSAGLDNSMASFASDGVGADGDSNSQLH